MNLNDLRHAFADSAAILGYVETRLSSRQDAIRILVECADDSPFSLRQWMDALVLLDNWLDERGLQLDTEEQIGYVACTADARACSASLTDLPAEIYAMLSKYGCERARPADAQRGSGSTTR